MALPTTDLTGMGTSEGIFCPLIPDVPVRTVTGNSAVSICIKKFLDGDVAIKTKGINKNQMSKLTFYKTGMTMDKAFDIEKKN